MKPSAAQRAWAMRWKTQGPRYGYRVISEHMDGTDLVLSLRYNDGRTTEQRGRR